MERKRVDLNKICKDYEIRAFSYRAAAELLKRPDLAALAARTSAFAFYAEGQPVIMFDSERPIQEVRFSIAHEIGHILLGHLSYRTKVMDQFPNFAEIEANIFAVALAVNDILCKYGQSAAEDFHAVAKEG